MPKELMMKSNYFYLVTDRFGNKSGGYTSEREIIAWAMSLSHSRGDFLYYKYGSLENAVDYLNTTLNHFSVYSNERDFMRVARQEQLLREAYVVV